jgi:predicted AAA+ superfamily ATPase
MAKLTTKMAKLYERKLLGELRKCVDKPFIVVVTGMRQVGKTTLFRMLFEEIKSENKAFLDLENPLTRRIFEEQDYDNIWGNLKRYGLTKDKKAYIFLDELQLAPSMVRPIKYLFDHYKVQFFVTGSSSFYLKNLFPESLAGRKLVFELFPLDFEEFLLFKGVRKDFYGDFAEKDRRKSIAYYERVIKLYDEYLGYGGFPKVVLAEDQFKRRFIEEVYTSYFEKDVKSLADFQDISKLQECILLLMQRVGSKLNISRIASELGVSRSTVNSYLSFLQLTYLISLVPPYSRSSDREVSGAKKVYLCDTGILNHMAQVSSGALLENAVFNSLKKRGSVVYYQRRSGGELDFVLKDEGLAIEVKETATEQDLKRTVGIAADLRLKQGYVVAKRFNDGRGFIPVTDL